MAKKASFVKFDTNMLVSMAILQKRPQTATSVAVEYGLDVENEADMAMCRAYADFFRDCLNKKKEKAAAIICPNSFVAKIRANFLNEEKVSDSFVEWLLFLGVNPDGAIQRTTDELLLCTKSLVLSAEATRKAEAKYVKELEKARKAKNPKGVVKPLPLKDAKAFQRGLAEGFTTWAVSMRKGVLYNEDGTMSIRGRA